jgi:pteridine reductase
MKHDKGKGVALITGAAKRVGRAIALRLADEGFDIAFTYLSSAGPAEELCDEIKTKGRIPLAIRADLTDPPSAIRDIEKSFSAAFARLDVLVNNASLYAPDAATDADAIKAAEQSRRFWAIHVESPLLLARTFAPQLRAAGGAVINMVDLMAERPMPGYLAYCASKAGLWNLTLGLARELAPQVRVNGIAPGVVEWPTDLPEEKKAEYLKRVPLARAGSPADVAETATFLVVRATYVTGQILRIDGGRAIA